MDNIPKLKRVILEALINLAVLSYPPSPNPKTLTRRGQFAPDCECEDRIHWSLKFPRFQRRTHLSAR